MLHLFFVGSSSWRMNSKAGKYEMGICVCIFLFLLFSFPKKRAKRFSIDLYSLLVSVTVYVWCIFTVKTPAEWVNSYGRASLIGSYSMIDAFLDAFLLLGGGGSEWDDELFDLIIYLDLLFLGFDLDLALLLGIYSKTNNYYKFQANEPNLHSISFVLK